eukprot:COSAG02_NODE_150_length_33596_cov_61.953966_19_plen_283_part_00
MHASQAGIDTTLTHGNHSWDDHSAVDWVWHQSRSATPGAVAHDSVRAVDTKGTAWIPLVANGRRNASLQIRMNNRTGNWADLGTNHGQVTAATLEVQLHYGRCEALSPDGGSFAYAVVPAVTRSDLGRLRSNDSHQPWTILSNTDALQAVTWRQVSGGSDGSQTLVVIQAIFWREGTLAPTAENLGLSVPSGLLVMSKLDGSTGLLELTVSDPWGTSVGAEGTTITVTGRFVGKNCSSPLAAGSQASPANSTIFAFGKLGTGNLQGHSATVACKAQMVHGYH